MFMMLLLVAFTEGKEHEFSAWSESELMRARKLAEGKLGAGVT